MRECPNECPVRGEERPTDMHYTNRGMRSCVSGSCGGGKFKVCKDMQVGKNGRSIKGPRFPLKCNVLEKQKEI